METLTKRPLIKTRYLENIFFLYEGDEGDLAIFRLDNTSRVPVNKILKKGKVVFMSNHFKVYLEVGKNYQVSGWVTNQEKKPYEIFYQQEMYLIPEEGEKILIFPFPK